MSGKSTNRLIQLFNDMRHTLGIRQHAKTTPKVLVGEDEHGNKYFKQDGDAAKSIKPKRWVEPINTDPMNVPRVPMHWDSWLRNRRDDPPTAEEVARVAERVKRGKAMDAMPPEHNTLKDKQPNMGETSDFPKYEQLYNRPGQRKPD